MARAAVIEDQDARPDPRALPPRRTARALRTVGPQQPRQRQPQRTEAADPEQSAPAQGRNAGEIRLGVGSGRIGPSSASSAIEKRAGSVPRNC